MSDFVDLIGYRFRLGADGSNGEIDCIHLVYVVLDGLGIDKPAFNPDWYTMSWRQWSRDLLRWGHRVAQPTYDGDVLLLMQDTPAFAVTWQTGILYINRQLKRVAWIPASNATNYHCFRSSGS